MREELEIALKKAVSFPGLTPPNNAAVIGKIEATQDVINIYKDNQGNYYYDTENGRKFEQDMQERKKRRDKEKRRLGRRERIT